MAMDYHRPAVTVILSNLSVNSFEFDDYYTTDYPEAIKSLPVWEIVIKVILYGVIIVASLLGNTLLIIVVFRNKRMHTATNYYIVNLGVADLMVALSCTWVHVVDDVTEGWSLGAFFCRINSFAHGKITYFVQMCVRACVCVCVCVYLVGWSMFACVYVYKSMDTTSRLCIYPST